MGKARRELKRARREARGTEDEAAFFVQEKRAARGRLLRRIVVIGLPVVEIAMAAALTVFLHEAQIAGIVLLGASVIWFPLAMGFLGSSIQPRDRLANRRRGF